MGKKMKQAEDRVIAVMEAGGMAFAAHQLKDLVEKSSLFTQDDKALYTATLDDLWNRAIERSQPAYDALTKKGH